MPPKSVQGLLWEGRVFVIKNIKRPERFASRSTRFPNDAKRLATAASVSRNNEKVVFKSWSGGE
jgi:hypothetical protein